MTPEEFNKKCVEELQIARIEDRVAVVGSGPSSAYVAPVATLKEQLCKYCGVPELPGEEFWVTAERAYSSNRTEYHSVIRRSYTETPHWQSRTYEHIARLPVKGWATLNYDDQLPRACFAHFGPSFARNFSVYPTQGTDTYASPQEFNGSQKKLVALHGYCDDNVPDWETRIVLKTSDYNAHYIQSPAPLSMWWRDMLLTTRCIFLGTSLREPGLHRVIEHLLPEHRDRLIEMNHIHLLDRRPDPTTSAYPAPGTSLFVVSQVYYDPIDSRFSGLLDVLSAFSNLPTARPAPRSPSAAMITPTDTFSFTST